MIDWSTHLPALQVIVPMLSAPLALLLQPRGLAWGIAVAASLFAFCIAITLTLGVLDGQTFVYQMGNWPAPYGIELGVDAFSALMLLVITGASSLALIAGRRSLDSDIAQERQPMFYAAWLLALAGLVGIPVAADAFNIFVFMEISSLASYVLIAGGPNRRALPAVFKYLIMGTIGATFYLIGVGLIYLMTGTLNMADIAIRIHDVADQKPILVAAGFITIGLALKAAVFPLHVWLPNAYTFAPNVVTVFLAACATKVSLYLLLRFDFFVFQPNLTGHDIQFAYFMMPLAVIAILVGSGVALYENNLKRLFAYSSVAQIGYILLGASLVSVAGLTASVIHMFNHALAKGTVFLVIVGLATNYSNLRLENIAGAAKHMPWTMGAFVIAGLSLVGVPGTVGFISKWYLISAALSQGTIGIMLVVVILISSMMAMAYVWKVIEMAYFGESLANATPPHEAPNALLIVTWVAALSNIYYGISTSLPVTLASTAAESLLRHIP